MPLFLCHRLSVVGDTHVDDFDERLANGDRRDWYTGAGSVESRESRVTVVGARPRGPVQKELRMHTRIMTCLWIGLMVAAATAGAARAGDDEPASKDRPSNRLAKETSPYLLLHAHNPVDWYPWGPEAFARAKAENKPIFLSVGYSSCYWCHVMERESFVDPEIAKALNASFVCIKVDREERPDVDQVYMAALQAFGPAGWPMSMFLTPDGRPFFGGTYFPPRDRQGSSGFLTLVNGRGQGLDQAASRDRQDGRRGDRGRPQAAQGREQPAQAAAVANRGGRGREAARGAVRPRARRVRLQPHQSAPAQVPRAGQPVVPARRRTATAPRRTTRPSPLKMVVMTLDRMARGGIRDHLGGGYHRYSTDRYWLVPHFEKMLYDNAQLASVHLAAFEITHDPRWRDEAEATFAFVERRMTAPEGGFYSALDAETKGEEGAYYVWTRDEVKAALGEGPDADLFAEVYGLTGEPNFEGGRYVLHEPRTRAEQAEALKLTPEELETRLRPLRARLLAARDKRPAPLCDDKVLTGWNGLMIAAYADGYRVLKVEKYRQAAEKAAGFLLEKLRLPDGRLLRTYRQGQAKLAGLPRGLRLPGPRPAPAARRDRRRALAAGSPGLDRPDDRRLRGPRGRGLLLHRRRPREPAGAGQGPVRQRLAQRQQHGDPRPDGALPRDRRGVVPRPRGQSARCLQHVAVPGPGRDAGGRDRPGAIPRFQARQGRP